MSVNRTNEHIRHVTLPSFLRRALRAFELKALIRDSGSELSRIGRSRNWRLSASREQLFNVIESIRRVDEPSWQWVITLLEKKLGDFTQDDIINLVKRNPGITVNELVILANCTIIEARKAIDAYEWMD
ncbi:ribosome recycling factor family protein [Thalassotalea sp. Y01]|uniref:ribosome recycling factor family protein n=1 Tax=Thalassotalea sp. Y01 TaxID=2729613 RepID=UPI00249DF0B9|nr:ribosome recycling factor family protein [Thalassotalea sp. Y01]